MVILVYLTTPLYTPCLYTPTPTRHTHSHSYLARTTPEDVARVEKQTYVCTEKKEDAVPEPKPGVESKLGNWKSPSDMDAELNTKFPGCMEGMYEQSTNHISLKDVM